MGPTTFSKHYCVCIQQDGTPREITRLGSVVTYKAIDYRSGQLVALQVIPLTSVDQAARAQFEEQAHAAQKLDHINIAKVFDVRVEDEHIVFVTEYLQGETADAWIVSHGPMAPDAVVRIGLQVVSALAAAMFEGLTHRSIQPSNLIIVPGTDPEGDWPFVKLLNFGLAGLRLYSEENEPRELVPTIGPQFASPEQLQHGTVDFRSQIFSLGATMCFLLTGAVPLAGGPSENGVVERALPSVGKIPRAMRKVLTRMLRYNPEERPQDPVIFAEELRKCMQKVEPRRGARHFGAPVATELPPTVERPRNRALAIGLAVAALLLGLVAVTAVLIPTRLQSLLHRQRELSTIGVPIGVPDSTPPAPEQTSSALGAIAQNAPTAGQAIASTNQTVSSATPQSNSSLAVPDQNRPPSSAVLASDQNSPAVAQPLPTAAVPAGKEETKNSPPKIVANDRVVEPPPPAEGPDASRSAAANSPAREQQIGASADNEQSQSGSEKTQIRTPQDVWNNLHSNADRAAASSSPTSTARPTNEAKVIASKRSTNTSRRRGRTAGHRPSTPPLRVGSMPAEFIGTTEDGSWILQLPNGKTVVTPPAPNPEDVPIERHRHVRRVRRAIPLDQQPPVVALPLDR